MHIRNLEKVLNPAPPKMILGSVDSKISYGGKGGGAPTEVNTKLCSTCDLLAVRQERGLCEERQASPLLRQGVYIVY